MVYSSRIHHNISALRPQCRNIVMDITFMSADDQATMGAEVSTGKILTNNHHFGLVAYINQYHVWYQSCQQPGNMLLMAIGKIGI